MRLLKAFIASFMPGVIKPLHALWNQLLAFIFLTFAVGVGLGPLRRSYRELDGDFGNITKFVASLFLTVMMLFFGLYSLRRASKISRS